MWLYTSNQGIIILQTLQYAHTCKHTYIHDIPMIMCLPSLSSMVTITESWSPTITSLTFPVTFRVTIKLSFSSKILSSVNSIWTGRVSLSPGKVIVCGVISKSAESKAHRKLISNFIHNYIICIQLWWYAVYTYSYKSSYHLMYIHINHDSPAVKGTGIMITSMSKFIFSVFLISSVTLPSPSETSLTGISNWTTQRNKHLASIW